MQTEQHQEGQQQSEGKGAEQKRLATAIFIAEHLLSLSTGHDDYQRKKIAFYAVATHFVKQFDPFPVLVVYGAPSTGKSSTLAVLRNICCKPIVITAETITDAALRRAMSDSNQGTLVIEEGDKISTSDLEIVLVTRYSKDSASVIKMRPVGRDWESVRFATFGATVIHLRNLFRDAAILRRIVPVRTQRNPRQYKDVRGQTAFFKAFKDRLAKVPTLPNVEEIEEIEPGVFECYKPLVALAQYLGAEDFLSELIAEMRDASDRLRDEEGYLEGPMLIRALISETYTKTRGAFTVEPQNILTRDLRPWIVEEYGPNCSAAKLANNQRNRILKEQLGFRVGYSHGRSRVYLTIPQLISVCDQYGIEDELIEKWREELEREGQ